MMRLLPILVAVMLCAAVGCRRSGGDAPVPLPRAYPRIQVYDSLYSPVADIPLHIELNSGAEVTVDSATADGSTVWLTAMYPAYGGARMYVTVLRASGSELAKALDNRRERMALNAGDGVTELIELAGAGGFIGEIAVTPAGTITSVQFLAHDGTCAVSGAFCLDRAPESADSLRPVTEAMRRDVIHLVKTLGI